MNLEKEEKSVIKVILVGADTGEDMDFGHSMTELESLAEALDKRVVGILVQHMEAVNKTHYIGKGKVQELRELIEEKDAEEVIFEDNLSPSQVRNLSEELEVPITDRTGLILDIFVIRARTREAKLQVETARLQYLLPRLVGNYDELGRQGGTSGSLSNRGSGEKKLELDRRRIEARISELKKELEQIAQNRNVKRKKREKSDIPQVALVGYTNAGKSTIMNHCVRYFGNPEEKQVLEKDMLFATLDTNVRLMDDRENKPFYLADTVGFIRKLPHGLVKAFRSTLEEVKYADLILQVVDFADENHRQHMQVTADTLKELGAGHIPQIVVYNKADQVDGIQLPGIQEDHIYMAAAKDLGISELVKIIREKLYEENIDCAFFIPYDKGNVTSYLLDNSTVYSREFQEDGVLLKVNSRRRDVEKYNGYVVQYGN